MSLKPKSPLGSAAVGIENILIVFMSTINLILLVLFSSAMELSISFLVLPFTVQWLTLVIAVTYLIAKASRVRGTPPSLSGAAFMFATQTLLGLVASVALTDRAWRSTLCDDFAKIPHSCRVALAVVSISWVGTTTAFAGILLSCAGPLYRSYMALRTPLRPNPAPTHQAFELVDIPSARYQPSYSKWNGREEWTEIPV
ncbi:hypothetical protein B0H12DRAFT_1228331 [Mycena haematopus]|nr:hypothetical protein B0H12DRAFT_1228331 [Mycena haematopus]